MGNDNLQEFGSREVLDFVAKDMITRKPKIYFDYLKTSQMTNKTATVYARGGQGNPRQIGWTGDRDTIFNCEDALFSAKNLGIFFGTNPQKIKEAPVHKKEVLTVKTVPDGVTAPTNGTLYVELGLNEYGDPIHGFNTDANHLIYVFKAANKSVVIATDENNRDLEITASTETTTVSPTTYVLENFTPEVTGETPSPASSAKIFLHGDDFVEGDTLIVDYYYSKDITEVAIRSNKYAGTYYWEGDTLFRDRNDNDHNAHIIIPKGKLIADTEFVFKPDGDPATYKFDIEALQPPGTDKRIVIMQIEDEVAIYNN